MSETTDKSDTEPDKAEVSKADVQQMTYALKKEGYHVMLEESWRNYLKEHHAFQDKCQVLERRLKRVQAELEKEVAAREAKLDPKTIRINSLLRELRPKLRGRLSRELIELFVRNPETVWTSVSLHRSVLKSSRASITQLLLSLLKKKILRIVKKGKGNVPTSYQLEEHYIELLKV